MSAINFQQISNLKDSLLDLLSKLCDARLSIIDRTSKVAMAKWHLWNISEQLKFAQKQLREDEKDFKTSDVEELRSMKIKLQPHRLGSIVKDFADKQCIQPIDPNLFCKELDKRSVQPIDPNLSYKDIEKQEGIEIGQERLRRAYQRLSSFERKCIAAKADLAESKIQLSEYLWRLNLLLGSLDYRLEHLRSLVLGFYGLWAPVLKELIKLSEDQFCDSVTNYDFCLRRYYTQFLELWFIVQSLYEAHYRIKSQEIVSGIRMPSNACDVNNPKTCNCKVSNVTDVHAAASRERFNSGINLFETAKITESKQEAFQTKLQDLKKDWKELTDIEEQVFAGILDERLSEKLPDVAVGITPFQNQLRLMMRTIDKISSELEKCVSVLEPQYDDTFF